jgi:phosphate-selective porin OprO/OprP
LKTRIIRIVFLSFIFLPALLHAQTESDERALIDIKDGISFSKSEIFKLNLRFRLQNRVGLYTRSGDDLGIDQIEAQVRRMRLRMDGYVLSPKISYYIQLSFSKGDQDLERGTIPQTVRDAIVYYTFNENFYIGFGQSKLPGNRQRVISSGNQQFAERSFANAKMNIDRDFGLFAYYTIPVQSAQIILKSALTTGEGRNASTGNNGIAHTWRLEFLPFGRFKDNGDYSEGDLMFEQSPKLSLAAGNNINKRARRTGGQLGSDLFEERDINTFIADGLFKYNGWALSAEYFKRTTPNASAITTNDFGQVRFVNTGEAYNIQGSRMLSRKTELALRFTELESAKEVQHLDPDRKTALIGASRYLNGHRIKLQTFGGYEWLPNGGPATMKKDFWTLMMQVEFGI